MSGIKFIHAADLHLDSQFQNANSFDEKWIRRLKDSTWKAFANLIDLAINEQVDFVILAGDIFDQDNYSVNAQLRFAKELQRLSERQIHTYILHGNHDYIDSNDKINKQLYNNIYKKADDKYIHVFSNQVVEVFDYYKNDQLVAKLYGRSYWKRHVTENLALQYIETEQLASKEHNTVTGNYEAIKNIAVLHGMLGSSKNHENFAPMSSQDLKSSNFGYWALGHVHQRNAMNDGYQAIVYPGNIQGRHINELAERGCYLVNWEGSNIQLDFRPLADIIWQECTVDLTGEKENDNQNFIDLLDVIIAELEKLNHISKQPSIIKLKLKGQSIFFKELNAEGVLEHINDLLSGTNLFVYEIINNTLPEVDLEKLRQQKTLLGAFLTIIETARMDEQLQIEINKELDNLFENNTFKKVFRNQKTLGEILLQVEQKGIEIFLSEVNGN